MISRWDMHLTICNITASAILNFRKFEFMSCDLYRHAILLLCAKFHWHRKIGWRVMAKKRFLKWRASAILNYRGPIMASLKAHVGLHVGRNRDYSFKFLFLRNHVLCTDFGNRQTDGRTDRQQRYIKPQARYRERRLNNGTVSCCDHKTEVSPPRGHDL